MDAIKYFFEANENRSREEEKQGYALVTLISASENSKITNMMINESLKSGKKIKIDFAAQSLAMNKKHILSVHNVIDPLTDELYEEISIGKMYEMPQFRELYEELSNVIGDLSQLKEGIKKK